MHIVLASAARERGGTWRHIEDVGVELGARGHRVTVGLLPAARELQAAATRAGLGWRPLLRTLRTNADVWHLHLHDTFDARSLAVLALRRSFGTAIVTEHLPRTPGSDPGLAPGPARNRGADHARTAFKRAQRALTAQTVVPSHGAARFMRQRYGLSTDDIVVAHNGVSSFPVSVPPPTGPGLEVVTVGALVDQKGLDVLLAAASRSRQPWGITIVGSGPRRAQLERMAAALTPGRARFVGWTEDPSRYLRASHVLCMPSRYEACPYAPIEASAWGRPVVGSRIDGLEEIVVPGRTGILVEPDDPDALAAALDGLWDDLAALETLGRGAREHVRLRFSIQHSVDRLVSIYEDVLSRP